LGGVGTLAVMVLHKGDDGLGTWQGFCTLTVNHDLASLSDGAVRKSLQRHSLSDHCWEQSFQNGQTLGSRLGSGPSWGFFRLRAVTGFVIHQRLKKVKGFFCPPGFILPRHFILMFAASPALHASRPSTCHPRQARRMQMACAALLRLAALSSISVIGRH
jgi:hypothetical protein